MPDRTKYLSHSRIGRMILSLSHCTARLVLLVEVIASRSPFPHGPSASESPRRARRAGRGRGGNPGPRSARLRRTAHPAASSGTWDNPRAAAAAASPFVGGPGAGRGEAGGGSGSQCVACAWRVRNVCVIVRKSGVVLSIISRVSSVGANVVNVRSGVRVFCWKLEYIFATCAVGEKHEIISRTAWNRSGRLIGGERF